MAGRRDARYYRDQARAARARSIDNQYALAERCAGCDVPKAAGYHVGDCPESERSK